MEMSRKDYTDLCGCIGEIIVPFAQVESSVDLIIALIFHDGGGKAIEKELPRALGKRIAFIEKSLEKLPLLSDFKHEGLEILQTLRDESEIRNHVVHSYVSDFNPYNRVATFTVLDAYLDKQMHTEVIRFYSLSSLLDTAGRIVKLGARMVAFGNRLAVFLVP